MKNKYETNRKEKVLKGESFRDLRKKLGYTQAKMSKVMTEYSIKTGWTNKLTAAQICEIETSKINYTVNSSYDYEYVLNSELLKTKIK